MTGKKAFQGGREDTTAKQKDELDQQFELLDGSKVNRILEKVNASHENYDTDLAWSQEESYRKGLIADTLIGGLLIERSIDETKEFLAGRGTSFYNQTEMDVKQFKPFERAVKTGDFEAREFESSWNTKRRYAEKIWRALGTGDEAITKEQHAAMVKASGMEPGEYTPMFWDMFAGRHDMSRSKAAKVLEMYFGDHISFEGGEEEAEKTRDGILRRRRRS